MAGVFRTSLLLLTTGAGTMAMMGPIAAGANSSHSGVLFRPVLCAVPPYDKFVTSPQPNLSADSCGLSDLNPVSMGVTPSKGSPNGYTYQTPQPAIILEGEHTTKMSKDVASNVVLLSGLPGSSVYAATPTSKGIRYVLGPAVMTSRAIASATVVRTQAGEWSVVWTTTPAGSAVWDRVARASFHQLLALDVGGVVVSAPIIEPTESSFTSFKGAWASFGKLEPSRGDEDRRGLAIGRIGRRASKLEPSGTGDRSRSGRWWMSTSVAGQRGPRRVRRPGGCGAG